MAILSIAILALQIVILAIGVLIGYHRGLGRSTVRLGYLVLIAVVSFAVGRAIAFSFSDEAVALILTALPEDALVLLNYSPELESLIAGMLGGLISPILFAVLFGLLQLFSLIFFKTISSKLVSLIYKEDEGPSWSKWAGAGVGLVSGYLVAMALLLPLTSALYMVDDISDKTIDIFSQTLEVELGQYVESGEVLDHALTPAYTKLAGDNNKSLPTPAAIIKALTSYGFLNENQEKVGKDNLAQALPTVADVAADALYAYQKTLELGGDEIDAIANAASRLADYLEDSPSIKQVAVSSLRAIGGVLNDGDSFLGMSLPDSDNPIVKQIVDSTINALATSSADSVKDNMLMLFGSSSESVKSDGSSDGEADVSNTGLYALAQNIDLEDPMSILSDEKLSSSFVATMGHMSNLSAMHDVVAVIRDYAMEELHSDADKDLADESYRPFYEEVCDLLYGTLSSCREQGITANSDIAKVLEQDITNALEANNFPVPDEYIPMVAICAVTEFNTDKYSNGITVKDLLVFFDIAEVPAWAN